MGELCQEIGADVQGDDIVDAHILPARRGRPNRVIARFHQRSKARSVFLRRKESKNIVDTKKAKLAINVNNGFAIQPNLTITRAKLYAQVQEFCASYNYVCSWVDYNTGKIYLKLKEGQRGHAITDTGDLLDINTDYKPLFWYFCSPNLFEFEPSSNK